MSVAVQTPRALPVTDAFGAHLLDDVRDVISRYCALPGEHELNAVVLWCAATHLVGAFDFAPRLVIRSAEKRSGKSRLLEVVGGLVYSPLRVVNASLAFVFRSLGEDPPPTLLFDEVDTIFGSQKVADKNEDLRGLLNAGFQRGLPFGRVVGSDLRPQEYSTFAMAALAGIGRMPETIEDRAVVVVMKRHRNDEQVQPFRARRDMPVLEELRDRLAAWADAVREAAGTMYPEMPVEDRAADLWEPLIVVADLAGGDWPRIARDAAVALTRAAAEEDTALSPNLRLLADIRTVFDASFMKSQDLCAKLRALPESPWEHMDLNPTKLGRRLQEYSIRTRHTADKTERGYHLSDFVDAFRRYLPSETASDAVQAVPGESESGPSALSSVRPAGDSTSTTAASQAEEGVRSVGPGCSPPSSDVVDAFGRVVEALESAPTPAVMPVRRSDGAVRATGRPKRQRRRTRGLHRGDAA
jgi:hypothetical protein